MIKWKWTNISFQDITFLHLTGEVGAWQFHDWATAYLFRECSAALETPASFQPFLPDRPAEAFSAQAPLTHSATEGEKVQNYNYKNQII